jgi:hypothetical protein
MQRTATPPEDFLDTLPEGRRDEMRAMDAAIAPVFAGQERELWEGVFYGGTQQRILGYGLYRYHGRSGAEGEWFVVGIAVQKDHLTLYVTGTQDGESLIKRLGPRLGKAKLGSGTATFRRLADVDLAVVVEMATLARELMSATR